MDDNRGQRRQNEPPIYSASSSRHNPSLQEQPQPRRPFPGAQGDRFRPPPLSTSPSGSSRGIGSSTGYGGYYPDTSTTGFPTAAIPQGGMSYHQSTTDYGQADSRPSQSFGSTYTPGMMYNVQQTGGPQAAAVYDAGQQFSSRQAAGLPMMATDVTGAYFQNEPTNAATTSSLQAQTGSSSTPQVYQQPGMHGYSTGSIATIGGMAAQTTPATDVRMSAEYPPGTAADASYIDYQAALKGIFQDIQNGVLAPASDALLQISDWLLTHVVELGLTSDNQDLHSERVKLWDDFNHAWLAMFQRQKEMMESGQQLQKPQCLVPPEGLRKMGKDLVKHCDSIERHGLVDYQFGVWEERIVEILEECLDLYEKANTSGSGGEGSSNERHR
ncbi:hypothetical protein CHGG_07286 [Chaetomium globosum CBS 148.51]|uniref:Uncharacterized protein n=1 Tax=Chaetomium globosum (strain ATCC 6205 / CBS 148.51 / DSM 1962 / NBRC 6347 / NRRL 1970) TaxID=306901 RepID=Q2GXL8_CHAGB|nr:uncharacterized protein CHGG_07286 [Chaetomium globosum CBS 148.51]EAQ86033.1 hypothetical protein CHGG_07286 [Chaetomium globosum CBS 148.51]